MLDMTFCDFLMVGRGSLGNPWIFQCINAYLNKEADFTEPTLEEKMDVMLRHIGTLCEYKGVRIGMREARKHAAWYIKGIRGAAAFRQEIGQLSTMDELKALAERVITSQE